MLDELRRHLAELRHIFLVTEEDRDDPVRAQRGGSRRNTFSPLRDLVDVRVRDPGNRHERFFEKNSTSAPLFGKPSAMALASARIASGRFVFLTDVDDVLLSDMHPLPFRGYPPFQ